MQDLEARIKAQVDFPSPSRVAGEVIALARDPNIDLAAKIPHGDGQTYLREILLIADHGAYHVGQLVSLRRALGHW